MTCELEERCMDVADLQVGMYVYRLDRPWEETPFPLQGLVLTSMESIQALARTASTSTSTPGGWWPIRHRKRR
jgi:hypothetical protein